MRQLAQFNIGRLAHDLDDPRVADFMNGIDVLNRIAERSEGFVWKYETEPGGVVEETLFGDPRIVVNLTVWESVERLRFFAFNTLHKHFYERRGEWFDPLGEPHFVMWWVPEGHRPTLVEAKERLEAYRTGGDGVFGWQEIAAEGAPA
ncbi:MAG: DUF3291 domain-containing protein [Roseovarius sp.]